MILWSLTACAATILVAVLAGALLGLGLPTTDGWRAAGMNLAAGTLMAALALPPPGSPAPQHADRPRGGHIDTVIAVLVGIASRW